MPRVPAALAVSFCAHGLACLVAWGAARRAPTAPAVTADLAPVELAVLAPPPPPETPEATPPPSAPTPPPATPPPPAAAARSTVRNAPAPHPAPTATGTPSPGPVGPPGEAPTPPTATPSPGPSVTAPAPRVLTATELLRGGESLATRGAAEGWMAPTAVARPERSDWGTGGRRCEGEACIAERALAPTRAGLAETARDHRPAGSGQADARTGRRALEELDLVRSVAGLGRAVERAPVVTIPGQRRTVGGGEAAVAEAFDQRHQSSFAGMTYGATTAARSYHLLAVELDVEQSPDGDIRALRVSRASGLAPLDAAAERALRAALGASDWTAGAARWSRWRIEVSNAAGANTPFSGNEGWTVLDTPSDGVRLRARVRMLAQRVTGAARDGGA